MILKSSSIGEIGCDVVGEKDGVDTESAGATTAGRSGIHIGRVYWPFRVWDFMAYCVQRSMVGWWVGQLQFNDTVR